MVESNSGGYTGLKDMFDGGGPGRSGAMFSSNSLDNYGVDPGGYVSQSAIDAMQASNPDQYNADFNTGIGGISNAFGANPLGSYGQEQALGAGGTNIGTTGLANLIAGGGVLGSIMNKLRGYDMSRVNPNLPLGMALGSSPNPNLRPANSPVQVIANGGLVGLRGYLSGGML